MRKFAIIFAAAVSVTTAAIPAHADFVGSPYQQFAQYSAGSDASYYKDTRDALDTCREC